MSNTNMTQKEIDDLSQARGGTNPDRVGPNASNQNQSGFDQFGGTNPSATRAPELTPKVGPAYPGATSVTDERNERAVQATNPAANVVTPTGPAFPDATINQDGSTTTRDGSVIGATPYVDPLFPPTQQEAPQLFNRNGPGSVDSRVVGEAHRSSTGQDMFPGHVPAITRHMNEYGYDGYGQGGQGFGPTGQDFRGQDLGQGQGYGTGLNQASGQGFSKAGDWPAGQGFGKGQTSSQGADMFVNRDPSARAKELEAEAKAADLKAKK